MNNRDLSLDYVKGFLVICMVIYHTISYFTNAGYDGTKYVRFVTGSFIFISGYIVSVFYTRKFTVDRAGVSRRLLARGFRLLLLFTIINVLINLSGIQSHKRIMYSIDSFLFDAFDIYIVGDSVYAAFQILVPIAYMLIIAPTILYMHKRKKTIICIGASMIVLYVVCKIDSFNLYGILIGLVGLSFGLMEVNQEKYIIKKRSIVVLLFGAAIYLMRYFDRNIIVYCVGIIIIIKLVYDFSKTLNLANYGNRLVLLLGEYSLIAYLIQIFFLQGLYQVFIKRRYDIGWEALMICIGTTIFLIVFSSILNTLRNRSSIIDRTYKAIFS